MGQSSFWLTLEAAGNTLCEMTNSYLQPFCHIQIPLPRPPPPLHRPNPDPTLFFLGCAHHRVLPDGCGLLLRGFVCTFSNHVWTLCRKRTFLDCGSYFIAETGWDGGLNFCDGVGWQGRVSREKNLLPTFKNSWVKVLQVLEVLPLEYTSVTLSTTCIASGLCVLCACVLLGNHVPLQFKRSKYYDNVRPCF